MSGYSQEKLNVYRGYIGERMVAKYLKKQGYTVASYMMLVDFSEHGEMGKKEAVAFLGDMYKSFLEMNKTLEKHDSGKEHHRRRFDFVAKKDNNYYIVEVKTNRARLPKWEKESFSITKKFGFKPMLVKTKVTLIADEKDITVKML